MSCRSSGASPLPAASSDCGKDRGESLVSAVQAQHGENHGGPPHLPGSWWAKRNHGPQNKHPSSDLVRWRPLGALQCGAVDIRLAGFGGGREGRDDWVAQQGNPGEPGVGAEIQSIRMGSGSPNTWPAIGSTVSLSLTSLEASTLSPSLNLSPVPSLSISVDGGRGVPLACPGQKFAVQFL
jgi:hypothetical protein